MELKLYLDILKRRAITIAIVTALAVSVAAAAGLFITPIYMASAKVRVIQDVGVSDLSIRETYGERLMNTYSRILTGWPVLEQAAERLDSSLSVGQLRQKTKVEVIPETELMRIIVHDTNPSFARDLANTLSELLLEHARSIYAGNSKSALEIVDEQLTSLEDALEQDRQMLTTLINNNAPTSEIEALRSQIQFKEDSYDRLLDRYELSRLNESLRANSIIVVEPARAPTSPSNSLGLKDIGIALLVGLSGGVGLALVLENLDTRIHSTQQLEHLTQLPVLGTVPKGLLSLHDLQQTNKNAAQELVEAYRLLGINLQALREDTSLKTYLITSTVPREGKSTTAINLAQVLAERGQTVFLLESDFRQPAIAKLLDIELEDDSLGLSDMLTGRSINPDLLSQAIHPAKQPSLFIISGGKKVNSPTRLLASPPMGELINYLKEQGQTTLLDAPPVLGTADVSILAPMMDGVILVVRQGLTKREQVQAAFKQLQASRACVIGTIFLKPGSRKWKL